MTLGLNRNRQRQKRRRQIAIVRWLLALIAIVAAGYYAYDTGTDLARRDVARLETELKETQAKVADLEAQNAKAVTDSDDVKRRHKELLKRFDEKVPTGERQDLLQLIDRRLAAGISTERLTTVLQSVENERRCEDEPVTKRFLVRTPYYQGANDTVRFGEGAITVTAEGQNAVDKDGNPEARFDPANPVTVRFSRLGGTNAEVAGLLPLHASVVIDDVDHRFTIVASDSAGFVNVTGQGCRYP